MNRNTNDVLKTMSPTMKRALQKYRAGELLHGRETLSLLSRGLLDEDGKITALGEDVLQAIEADIEAFTHNTTEDQ